MDNILHFRDSIEKVSEDEGLPVFEVNHIIKNGGGRLKQNIICQVIHGEYIQEKVLGKVGLIF